MKRTATHAILAVAAAALMSVAAPAAAHGSRTQFSFQFVAPLHGATVYHGSPHYRRTSPYYWSHDSWSPHPRPWIWGPPAVIYSPPPVLYSPPTVITIQPPVYIERSTTELLPPIAQAVPATPLTPPAPPVAHWYYCAGSRAYYPYVSECPGGWQPVPSQPAR
jgi:hypothetical protein